MERSLLDFYQIYYKDEQRDQLYDFAIPFPNNHPTPFLENDVIRSVVPGSTADLIGICSWQLKRKRNLMPSKHVLKADAARLNRQRILSHDFDVAILTPRLPDHKTLFMSAHWHGGVWSEAFSCLSEFLKKKLHVAVPYELNHAIYENHFIAKGPLYLEYVQSCLDPVMKFMQQQPVFYKPSGYKKIKENLAEFDQIKYYQQATGLNDWVIGVFLLEHLFSIWINSKNLRVINL